MGWSAAGALIADACLNGQPLFDAGGDEDFPSGGTGTNK
jgi:hypothetical protein